ncbi:Holliday junction branch migration protein RuvA [Treponema sp.]|uniref:Holliday junction branch migration protein RuvA n=1 Tax=Treponema sp. TaxID=166 RepID=UPI00257A6C53|nr:Holliday junction branch migration protein RuvA [Treponema sp.]MBE6354093.1 Holliday junction branch migration protein RuvA [Treponema sp.]
MFNSITGIITGKFPQKLLLENNGIEWDLICPDTSLDVFPPAGNEVKVYTYLQHSDVLMSLYGFASDSDRQLFFDLMKVDGIGPKAAVKIMSSITSRELVNVLENGDLAALEKVPGVGKKTAGKILLQLKGKLSLDNSVSVSKQKSSQYGDVVTALVDMGYERVKALEAVEKVSCELSKETDFSEKNTAEKEDAVFRRALLFLAR